MYRRFILKTLTAKPRLLMLNEPTQGIRPGSIKEIGRVIRMLAERGDIAVLLVKHFCNFVQ